MFGWTRTGSASVVLAIVVMAAVCGCGGGGGGGSGSGASSISLDKNSISVTTTPWEGPQIQSVIVTVQNMPADGLYGGVEYSNNGLQFVDIFEHSANQARVELRFSPADVLQAGTHSDTVTIRICYDEECNREVRNSPAKVSTSLTVQGKSSATFTPATMSVTDSRYSSVAPTRTATISISEPGPIAPYIQHSSNFSLVQSIAATSQSTSQVRLDFTFRAANGFTSGVYTEDLQVKLCYDPACSRQLTGSPISIPATYTITNDAVAEAGLPELPFVSRIALSHDVIDAEYSAQLESIVMVSSSPRSALYVYDTATGEEHELALNRAPVSVSVGPDGTKAAVGHDALITYVDLPTLGQPGAPAPLILDISTKAFDIVLDGNGYVHAFAEQSQWQQIHSVEIATNIETLGIGSLYAGSRARLHPSGQYIYTADNGLSPSDIAKHDITGGSAAYLWDSPYHGDYGMCGNVWTKEDGETLYTACGNTFTSSQNQLQDMRYSGRLQLSEAQPFGYAIASLSQSDEMKEIALVEWDNQNCSTFGDPVACHTRVGLYESDFLNRLSTYSIPPITQADTPYAQRGLFVFHSENGSGLYMISRLTGLPNATGYYLTTLR